MLASCSSTPTVPDAVPLALILLQANLILLQANA
jgi:hypothetical protein